MGSVRTTRAGLTQGGGGCVNAVAEFANGAIDAGGAYDVLTLLTRGLGLGGRQCREEDNQN